jgi:hypothetical protein
MVYDINIHELNLEPFRDLKFLDEILLKTYFLSFLNNRCIIIFLKKKPTTISKMRRFYEWELHHFYDFLLFDNVL